MDDSPGSPLTRVYDGSRNPYHHPVRSELVIPTVISYSQVEEKDSGHCRRAGEWQGQTWNPSGLLPQPCSLTTLILIRILQMKLLILNMGIGECQTQNVLVRINMCKSLKSALACITSACYHSSLLILSIIND